MNTLTNYKPEDITPSMRKYLGMPDAIATDSGTHECAIKAAQTRKARRVFKNNDVVQWHDPSDQIYYEQGEDSGTTEGAKKGWETRRLGGTSLSAGEIINHIKFSKVAGFSLSPSSGMIVHVRGSSQPHIVADTHYDEYGNRSCEVLNPYGEKRVIDSKAIVDYWDGDNDGGPSPENARKTAMRLLRRWGVEIPSAISNNMGTSYISGDFDSNFRHFPSEREVYQVKGRYTWKYKDDNSDVPGFSSPPTFPRWLVRR